MFPLSANQSMAIDGGATGTAEGANRRFAFKARILGSDSPHVFLPDVCDPAFAADEDYIYKVIAMHTTFISTNVYEGVAVTRGDMVLVELEKSGQTYNLEYGMFKTLLSAESPTATAGTACSSLANLVGGWEAPQPMQMGDVPVDGGTVSAGGASPRKCSGTEFCTQFIQAKHYRAASRTASDIRMVVVHATAGKGGTSRAIGGATRMAKGPTHAVTAKKGYTGPTVEYGGKTREACRSGICKQQGKPYQLTEPPVSAHYFVDQGGNIVQGVADKDIAYHGSNTNSYSIGIEHTLTTKDPAEYTDVLYDAAAKLGAKLAIKYDIPVKRTTDQKGTGFIAHSDISQKNPHADPGDLWDWDKYMKKIQHYVDNPGEGLQEAGGSSEAVATADDKCKDHPGSTYFAGDEEYYEGCYNGEEWAGYAST
jgi:N-acetyl-anhydromuramyl-L-alanine amidase AmpD